MNSIRTLLTALIVLLSVSVLYAAGLPITADGKPKAAIVIAESVRPNDLAVTALVSHIKEMSGATLPVIAEKELATVKVENGRIVAPEGETTRQTYILIGDG